MPKQIVRPLYPTIPADARTGGKGSVEVSWFSPPDAQSATTRLTVPLLAALTSFLLHTLLLVAAIGGSSSHKPPSPHLEAPSSLIEERAAEDAMRWIALEDTPGSESGQSNAASSASMSEPRLVPIHPPAVNLVAARFSDEQGQNREDSLDAPADEGAGGKLYGLYVGQISARIDRAWHRPRSPIGAPIFACGAKVVQDSLGNVLELAFENCNGDARWQTSLANAIKSASPLPAPPDPSVFRTAVHLMFRSEAYGPQSSRDLYESEESQGNLKSDLQVTHESNYPRSRRDCAGLK
jgi:hypothetical protein